MANDMETFCGCIPWRRRNDDVIVMRARPSSARPTSVRPTSARPTSARPTSARPTSARPTSARPTSARPTSARPSSTARGSKVLAKDGGQGAVSPEPAALGWKFKTSDESAEDAALPHRDSAGTGAASNSDAESSTCPDTVAPLDPRSPARARGSVLTANTGFPPEHDLDPGPASAAASARRGSASGTEASQTGGPPSGRRLGGPASSRPSNILPTERPGQAPAEGSQQQSAVDATSRLQALQELHRMRHSSVLTGTGTGDGLTPAAAPPLPGQGEGLAAALKLLNDAPLQCDSFTYNTYNGAHPSAHHARPAPAGGVLAPPRLAPLPPLHGSYHGGSPPQAGGLQTASGQIPGRKGVSLYDTPLHSRPESITAAIPGSLPSMSYAAGGLGLGKGTAAPAPTRPDVASLATPQPQLGLDGERASRFGQQRSDQEEPPGFGELLGQQRRRSQEQAPWPTAHDASAPSQDTTDSGYNMFATNRQSPTLSPTRPSGNGGRSAFGAGYAGGVDRGSGAYSRQASNRPSRGWGASLAPEAREPGALAQGVSQSGGNTLERLSSQGVIRGSHGGMAAPRCGGLAPEPPMDGVAMARGAEPTPLFAKTGSLRSSQHEWRPDGQAAQERATPGRSRPGYNYTGLPQAADLASLFAKTASLRSSQQQQHEPQQGGPPAAAPDHSTPERSYPGVVHEAAEPTPTPTPLFAKTGSFRPVPQAEAHLDGQGERGSPARWRGVPGGQQQQQGLWPREQGPSQGEPHALQEEEPRQSSHRPVALPVLSPAGSAASSAKALLAASASGRQLPTRFGAEVVLEEEEEAPAVSDVAYARPPPPEEQDAQVAQVPLFWSPSTAGRQAGGRQDPAVERKASVAANEAMLESLLSGGGGLDFASVNARDGAAEELERFDRVDDAMTRLESIMAAPPLTAELARPQNAVNTSFGNAESDFVGSSPVGAHAQSLRVRPW